MIIDQYIRNCIFYTHLQISNMIVSNTRIGPVLPMIVSGWPENKWYTVPARAPPKIDSIALCIINYYYHSTLDIHKIIYSHDGILCCVAQQTSKCYDWCQHREIKKNHGCNALKADCVTKIWCVEGNLSFDISDEPTEKPENVNMREISKPRWIESILVVFKNATQR